MHGDPLRLSALVMGALLACAAAAPLSASVSSFNRELDVLHRLPLATCDELRPLLTEAFAAQVPPCTLARLFQSIASEHGTFLGATVTTPPQFVLEYEHATILGTIQLDESGRIAGLWLQGATTTARADTLGGTTHSEATVFAAAPLCARSKTVTTLTTTGTFGLAAFLVGGYVRDRRRTRGKTITVAYAAIVILALNLVTLAFSPRSYEVRPDAIVIKFLLHSITIPASTIEEVSLVTPEQLRGGARSLGSGGMWGFLGAFSSQELGQFQRFSTSVEQETMIRGRKTYLISPADPAAFLASAQRLVRSRAGAERDGA